MPPHSVERDGDLREEVGILGLDRDVDHRMARASGKAVVSYTIPLYPCQPGGVMIPLGHGVAAFQPIWWMSLNEYRTSWLMVFSSLCRFQVTVSSLLDGL